MSDQARRRASSNSAASERQADSKKRAAASEDNRPGGPRPMEFDAAGFPIRQRNSEFIGRVARLLRT